MTVTEQPDPRLAEGTGCLVAGELPILRAAGTATVGGRVRLRVRGNGGTRMDPSWARPRIFSRAEAIRSGWSPRSGDDGDGAAGVVEQRVLDRGDGRARARSAVPADHHQVRAGRVAGQHPGRMPGHHVLADCHPGVLLPPPG